MRNKQYAVAYSPYLMAEPQKLS